MTGVTPIFLLSSDRSGSNLLLRLVGSHKEITAPPTSQLISNLYKAISSYEDLDVQKNWDMLLRNASRLHKASYGNWSNYADLNALSDHKENRSIHLILSRIFDTEGTSKSASFIALKTHHAYNYAAQLQRDFPNARYIFLVRDPRDMALSWLKTAGLRGGIMRAAKIWKSDQEGFWQMSKQLGSQCHFIRYEDVLSDAAGTVSSLCEFIGLSYDPNMLNFHMNKDTQDIAGSVQAWNNLSHPLMHQNFKKYKTELSEDQRCYIEHCCQSGMEALGYEIEVYNSDCDIKAISKKLEADEPWDKPAYANIPADEKQNHVSLREAIDKLLSASA